MFSDAYGKVFDGSHMADIGESASDSSSSDDTVSES